MTWCRTLTALCLLAVFAASTCAVDLAITAEPYFASGLFTNPLIPAEKDTVKITVRATVEGDMPEEITADLAIIAADGAARHYAVDLEPEEGQATGSIEWQAWQNGRYTLEATLDPDDAIAESNEQNNFAAIELPVVIAGRQPHIVWYHDSDYLRWPTMWAGKAREATLKQWQERGVMPLKWAAGFTAMRGEITEDRAYRSVIGKLEDWPEVSGLAIDEVGYYPKPESEERFQSYMEGIRRAYQDTRDDYFLLIWHCGSLYPEQAALYRGACDLVAIESYVFNWGPKGLGTENFRDFLDMKMLPARQCDLLGPTGKGTQVITTVDLTYPTFNRGMMESIFRHLRCTWPEMRGIGFFGLCTRDAPEEGMAEGIANNKFVDRLCHDYFIMPVVTILPGNLWVNSQDDGSYLVTAAVSNIGGMDSGPVAAKIYADGKVLKTVQLKQVPAGNNLKENQARVEARWTPQGGAHTLRVELGPAPGSTILDNSAEMSYYVQ